MFDARGIITLGARLCLARGGCPACTHACPLWQHRGTGMFQRSQPGTDAPVICFGKAIATLPTSCPPQTVNVPAGPRNPNNLYVATKQEEKNVTCGMSVIYQHHSREDSAGHQDGPLCSVPGRRSRGHCCGLAAPPRKCPVLRGGLGREGVKDEQQRELCGRRHGTASS